MRAMVLRAPSAAENDPLEQADLEMPAPGPGELRLRVLACGVCHTDLHIVEGELSRPRTPIVPGHQIVGVVDATGARTHRRPGEVLGVTWLYSTCGRCEYCTSDRENLCDEARFTGLHADGGYAEYVVVREDFAQPLPSGLPPHHAAPLLCAGVIGYRALRLSGIQPGQRLGLFGFGASAHVTIQVARHWGCEVYAFSRSDEHRRHALELGAVWAGSAQEDPPTSMHASIVFAPVGSVVHDALRSLGKGGTVAVNAVHMSPIPELPYERIYFERTLKSVANLTRRDARELLELAATIDLHTDVERHPLEHANEALQRLKRSEIRGAAVLDVASS
jgi:propanol-preferring alcohol dehydrogenase